VRRLAVALAAWCAASACAALPNDAGPPGDGRVAVTFDDGPSEPWTGAILDILAREQVRATFFVVGVNVERHPALARRIVAEGHVIANHTHHHLYTLTMLPGTTFDRELREGAAAIQAATGRDPRLVRWPVGVVKGNGPRAAGAVAAADCVHVNHSGRIFDAGGAPTAEAIIERALALAQDGAIIALHDGHSAYVRTEQSATVAALPAIIAGLRRRGLRLVTVPELLGERAYQNERTTR
jgi:peptidoglycan/xylan/chitin deacetylase (PgdA/CDA1 family)